MAMKDSIYYRITCGVRGWYYTIHNTKEQEPIHCSTSFGLAVDARAKCEKEAIKDKQREIARLENNARLTLADDEG